MWKVLGRVSSINVRKVMWACSELGLAVEREDWGAGFADPKAPEFLRLNPNGQVPVLIYDGYVLWESNAILIYLAEKYGGDLLPEDLRERGLVHQWLSWQVSELNPSWGYAVRALIRKMPGYDDPERIAACARAWAAKMAILEGQLARTGAYAAGQVFSIADIALGLSVHRWFGCPIERPDLPAVAAYYERLKARPAALNWLDTATP